MSEYIVRIPSDMPYEIKAELYAWYVNSEPIVRCRDCKHYMDYEHEPEPNLGYCYEHDREEVRDSYFCAWGERVSE